MGSVGRGVEELWGRVSAGRLNLCGSRVGTTGHASGHHCDWRWERGGRGEGRGEGRGLI